MKMFLGFVSLLAALSVGCSSSADAGPNGQTECERFVSGLCARAAACEPTLTNAACKEKVVSQGMDCSVAPYAGKSVDPELTNQCLAAFNAVTCAEFESPSFKTPDACITFGAQYRN